MTPHRTLPLAAAFVLAAGLLLPVTSAAAAEIAGVQVRPKGRLLVDSVNQVVSPSGAADARIDLVRVRQAFLGLDAKFNDRLTLRF
ncbi:MAG: hypothetical protein IM643_00275 [Phenylobacterium sp.]|nr:hypothetical protein [Phenylobacterium sp.]